MPSRERLPTALGTDRCEAPPAQSGDARTLADALEEVARADARAEAARARAIRLNQEAAGTSNDQLDTTEAAEDTDGAAIDGAAIDGAAIDGRIAEAKPEAARRARMRRRILRHPGRKSLAAGTAVLLICAALGTSGYVVWYHRNVANERQRAAQFAAAARQGAITMMSIDATKARDDVQRFIDDTTGPFKAGMLLTAEDLVKSVEESKVSTKLTVQAVAVQSMTDDSAVVLVAARAEAAGPGEDEPSPRSWRIVMTVQREDGQIKISNVETLP